MNADLQQLGARNPASNLKLAQQERQIVVYMAILGDPKSNADLADQATSADPAIALQGQMDQLAVRWTSAGKNADAQDTIIPDLAKLDKAHADSPDLAIFNYRLYQTAAAPTEAARLKTLIANDLQNPVATKICQTLDAGAKLGQAQDKPLVIAGRTIEGKAFSTRDWAGKVILVDFWASWCGPCRGELPRVKAMYDQYHANGLEVLGVSNDYSSEALTKFVAQDQLPWPQLFDAEAAAQQQFNPITLNQGITAIPVMFLIDRKGIVRSITAREDMESLIPKLLAEPS
jgi:peroxiredoxin